jgi:choline dehydrogenase-like flavoprotein
MTAGPFCVAMASRYLLDSNSNRDVMVVTDAATCASYARRMLIDLEEPGAVKEAVQRSRVCIVGAGVAGLVLATRLASRGVIVHLLEGGGRANEGRSQSLYEALMAKLRHTGTTKGRFRLLGGSSTRWGAQLLPFTPDIYHPPAYVPSPAWPIDDSELKPYYAEIERLMRVDSLPLAGDGFYDAMGIASADRPPTEFLGDDLRLRFSKWAPFGARNLAGTLACRPRQATRLRSFCMPT